MKKKMLTLLLAVSCVISFTGCEGKELIPDTEITETNEAEAKSPLGYTMTYDPEVFTFDAIGTRDVFTYNAAENLDAPVYISVQSYADMDVEILAKGLVLQSGMDAVEVHDSTFGADDIETKSVYIEKEINGITQIQIFDAIPVGEGSLLVEIGSYAGVPEMIEQKLEEMEATFSMATGAK